ncbi:MAG: MerC domain-containing protein [Gemmatimonadaceae bacterium]|nr:MerC domain-containing protein [Gemmatimonadaceae bacterium]
MTTGKKDIGRFAGGAGAIAATCAALCCAGAPIIVSILAATGLSFLRNDAILLPVIGIALLVALWGFWVCRRAHRASGPFVLGLLGSIALVAGVVFLHGSVAKMSLGVGTAALLAATIWNALLPPPAQSCEWRWWMSG